MNLILMKLLQLILLKYTFINYNDLIIYVVHYLSMMFLIEFLPVKQHFNLQLCNSQVIKE